MCTEVTGKVLGERRQAFRLVLEERLGVLTAPREIMDATAGLLGRHLGATRVFFVEAQADGRSVVCHSCYADGVEPVSGLMPIALAITGAPSPSPQDCVTEVVTDLVADPANGQHAWSGLDARALVAVPVLRHGVLRARLYVVHRQPHRWSSEDVSLIEEVAARTWSVVERVQAEAAERESMSRLQLALDAGGLAEITFGVLDGSVQHASRFAELLGHPPGKKLTLQEIRSQYHPEDHDRVVAERRDILASGQAFYEVEKRVVWPDGEVRWIHGRGNVHRDPAGQAVEVTAVYVDTTLRKNGELALMHLKDTLEQQVAQRTAELYSHQARARAAFETSYTFQGLMALDGTLLDANQTALRSIDSRLDQVVGRPVWETPWFSQTPGMAEAVRAVVSKVAQGAEYREEMHLKLPTGWRWFDFSMRPIRDEAGTVVAIVPEAVETTERRLAEEALLQSRKLEAMGQLTGGVAHDFNNLLTPIMGGLDMLARGGMSPEREQRIIATAAQSAERARLLVQRLLAFARRQPLQAVAVDIEQVVEGMADLIRRTSGPQVRVSLEIAQGLSAAKADPNQLEMALLNLAVNARDAMPDGGMLRITAGSETVGHDHRAPLAPGRYVRLSVADTGVGMDATTLARAVEPFFSTKGVGRGTGLGLSMAHGLALQLGGTLILQSTPGLGTNVELWLPAIELAAEAGKVEEIVSPARTSTGTVLLVDDEDLVRSSIAYLLAELGYRVIEAASAEEALRLMADGLRIDVLVTDHLMPGMSGTDLIQALQQDSPGLRALLVSGYADVDGIAPGVPRLTKPFRRRELVASLAALLA